MALPSASLPPSLEEKLSEFDSVPLFMKSLPAAEDTDDTALSALQALVHDGTPDEIAQGFKDNGNDYFKGKRYKEARGFYTQGVDAQPADPVLLEALLCNRAACNLELKNFGAVLRDCSRALTVNPRSSKAFYRSSLALVALERFDEAVDCCDRCLQFDEKNSSILALREKAQKGRDEQIRKQREKEERARKELETKKRLRMALKERNVVFSERDLGSPDQPYIPHFDPSDPGQNTLILPVWFLYPQHGVSDIISHFSEDTPFGAHLDAMFPPEAPPPPFDAAGQYIAKSLVVYASTQRKRLFKVGRNMTLRDVCMAAKAKDGAESDGLAMKEGCLSLAVLPKGDEEKRWVEEFKKIRDLGGA